MFKNITVFLIIISIGVFSACVPDAAHDNPIDPYLSKSQDGITFNGTVYSIYQPYQPLENVRVSVESLGKYVYTNTAGQFEINDLQEDTYQIVLFKDNYQSDTLNVTIDKQNPTQQFYLNAFPQLSNIKYYSKKVSTIFSDELLVSVIIEIEVNDPDGPGDIDSALVEIEAFSFKKNLTATLPAGAFQLIINQDDIAPHNIHQLVEKPLWINLTDNAGAQNRVGPFFISRFIESTPETISPANQEIASQPIFFIWQEIELPYSFSFEVNVYKRESGLSQLIFSQAGINSKATYYNYNSLLNNGIYFWTIKIVDALNNNSESEETVFQIR